MQRQNTKNQEYNMKKLIIIFLMVIFVLPSLAVETKTNTPTKTRVGQPFAPAVKSKVKHKRNKRVRHIFHFQFCKP